jgi:hypothetical protein
VRVKQNNEKKKKKKKTTEVGYLNQTRGVKKKKRSQG